MRAGEDAGEAARLDGLRAEIEGFQHAVQSAVAYCEDRADDRGECSPKHLRVGVNSALIDSSAMAKLLIDKGLITEVEYFTSLRDFWKREYEDYRERGRAKSGNPLLDFA